MPRSSNEHDIYELELQSTDNANYPYIKMRGNLYWDGSAWTKWDGDVIRTNVLVPDNYDYIALTYVAAGNGAGEIETATYKTGGSGGTTVATLTITYNSDNKIATVTKA